MKKKLFTNYNFEFDKNEKKLITNFCKQALKQMNNGNEYYAEIKAFNSIMEKIQSGSDSETIKFTRDEKTRLTHQLKQNIDYLGKQADKSWFIKKWLVRSLLNQYTGIYNNHFRN